MPNVQRKISFNVREDQYQTLLLIKNHLQCFDQSEALRTLINDGRAKYLENYVTVLKDRSKKKTPPKSKVRMDIVEQLNGIIENIDGVDYCCYTRYEEQPDRTVKPIDTKEPVEFLTDDMIEAKWITLDGTRGLKAKQLLKL